MGLHGQTHLSASRRAVRGESRLAMLLGAPGPCRTYCADAARPSSSEVRRCIAAPAVTPATLAHIVTCEAITSTAHQPPGLGTFSSSHRSLRHRRRLQRVEPPLAPPSSTGTLAHSAASPLPLAAPRLPHSCSRRRWQGRCPPTTSTIEHGNQQPRHMAQQSAFRLTSPAGRLLRSAVPLSTPQVFGHSR